MYYVYTICEKIRRFLYIKNNNNIPIKMYKIDNLFSCQKVID